MAGYWRSLYYYMGWVYHSENDRWDERQKHLKYLCTQQIKTLDIDSFLGFTSLKNKIM